MGNVTLVDVKHYKDERAYQKDAPKMAKKGYRPTNVESHQPKSSGCRLLMGGFLFGRKKPVLIVTYQWGPEPDRPGLVLPD